MNKKPLEIYVHIPFCVSKCSYCDFLSFPADEAVREGYTKQLTGEIIGQSASLCEYQVDTVFIGGGTPSLLTAPQMEQVMTVLHRSVDISPQAEITIESNPGTLTREKLKTYRGLGINRISIGLQSSQNQELLNLGRIHTYEDFLQSYQLARQAGFDNLNVDLMSALPGQTVSAWEQTLQKVAGLEPEHISAYSLILEPGTAFYDRYHQTPCRLPDEEDERQMYQLTQQLLQAFGYCRYEISNYAKPGYACRHNIGYWTGVPYIGFGLGASSYFEQVRFCNVDSLDTYLSLDPAKLCQISCKEDRQPVSRREAMEEFMFLGLRLTTGVCLSRFFEQFGQSMEQVYGKQLHELTTLGLLQQRGEFVCLTDRGVDLSNQVLARFLIDEA